MTFATATVTTAEAVAFVVAAKKACIALREVYSGECTPANLKRNTLAEMDTMVAAITASITAMNA